MKSAAQLIEEASRQVMDEHLTLCTPKQQTFFWEKCYPSGVPANKIQDALALILRTLDKSAAVDSGAKSE